MPLIILSFVLIAAMRVIQSVCGKVASNHVHDNERFFRYGTLYQFIAALLSIITLCIVGFYGFDLPTVICALLAALILGLDIFSGIEAQKGAPIIVCTMFALGGLAISCLGGVILFEEQMSFLQIIGLCVFFLGAYLLSSADNKENSKKINKKTYLFLIVVMLTEGLITIVQKYFSVKVVGGNVAMFSFLMFTFNAMILFACVLVTNYKRKNREVDFTPTKQTNEEKLVFFSLPKVLFICGSLLAFALFVINYTVTELGKTVDSVILFPVTSAITIVISTIVGWVVFKQKLTVKNTIGLILGFVSIILISIFTPETLASIAAFFTY